MTEQFELKMFCIVKMRDDTSFEVPIQNPQNFDLNQLMASWKASDYMIDTGQGLALMWPPLWVRVVGRTVPIQPAQPQETKQ